MKHQLVAFFVLLFVQSGFGQNWLRGVGGAANDEGLDITPDGQGNYIVSGFYSFGVDFNGTVLNSVGETDAFVARTNQQGQINWVKQFGGTGSDMAYANDLDANGNIFVSGYYSGTMTVDGVTLVSNNGSQDVFLAKLNANGDLLWIRDFGGTDHDFVYDLAIDQEGNPVMTGNFKGTATIGAATYSSMIDPEDNDPSYDIFVVKYDPAGNVLWSKHGQAHRDDRGTGLAINHNNEIALIGQFSDTLTMGSVYPNQVYNTGFMMLLDADGTELWMRKMSASMCTPYDVVFHQDSLIYATGDFTGQLAVFTAPLTTTTSAFQNKIFLVKMNTDGDVLWLENDGSNSQFSSRAIDIDVDGFVYVSGYFKCRLDEYSLEYGEGVFYSAGYRDIFIARYSSSGIRNWQRQLGGPGDDVAWDLDVSQVNQPIITGAFSKYFHAPDGGNFIPTSWTPPPGLHAPNESISYCSDTEYGEFATILSTGHQDILLAKPIDLSREPYDFFEREGLVCTRDFLTPCINENCPDTIQSCTSVILRARAHSGPDGYIGPSYDYLWSTAGVLDTTRALTSDNYWLLVSREDGCYVYSDTVTVIIHPIPSKPHISDDVIINTESFLPNRIFSCFPATIELEMGNVDTVNNYYGWSLSSEIISHPYLDTTVNTSGFYVANHVSPFGCHDSTIIEVQIDDWANQDTLDPHILVGFGASDLSAADTLFACEGDWVYYMSIDSANYQTVGLSMPYCSSNWNLSFPDISASIHHYDWHESEPFDLASWMMGYHFTASTSTRVILDVEITNHCNADTSNYFLHHEFYLNVSQIPMQEFGPHRMCPGDTIEIGVVGGDHFQWDGPGIVGSDTLASCNVNDDGIYEWVAWIFMPSGSQCFKTDTFRVMDLEAPDIIMIPEHGVICPNDSVQLTAPIGSNYQWIGPNNAVVGSTQTIYANTPGFYFFQYTNPEGCYLISNEVEVRGFNSPYMEAIPQQTICEGGTVVLTVFANEGTILDWPPPLVDSVSEQEVYQAGYYEVTASFCGMTDTLNITVIDVSPSVELNIAGFDTICSGMVLDVTGPPGFYSYQWSNGSQDPDIEVSEAGTYFLTAENSDGCIGHSDTLFVEVLPAPDPPLLSDTVVCFGGNATFYDVLGLQSVYWFNQELDSLGILASISADSIFAPIAFYGAHFNGECFSLLDTSSVHLFTESQPPQILGALTLCPADSLQLSAAVSSVLTYSWLLPDSTFAYGELLELSDPQSGTYTLLAEHPICGIRSIEQEVSLVQTESFVINLLMGATLNCVGDSVELNIPGPFNEIVWHPSESNSDVLVALENVTVWASVVDTNGCVLNADSIQIQFQEPPEALVLQADTVCAGETALINIATAYGLWLDDGSTLNSATNPFLTNTLNTDTTFTFLISDQIGCQSEPFDWPIEVIDIPAILEVTCDTIICVGDELTLSASPSGIGFITFYDESATELGTAGPNGQLVVGQVSEDFPFDGIYAILEMDGCSVQSDHLQLSVLPVPTDPILIMNGMGCPDDTVLIHADDTVGLTHHWVGPNGFASTDLQLVFDPIEPSEQGTYSLYVIRGICASNVSSIEVLVAAVPSVSLMPDTTICLGEMIELMTDQSYDQVLWSTGSFSELISVGDSGVYWIRVTNEAGCTASDTVLIETVNCLATVGNIFTPNNDGINDVFQPNTEGLKQINVNIFNRFGRLIYHWNELEGSWDGTMKVSGMDASEGTYYFIAEYIDISNRTGIQKGFIELIR